MAKPGLKHGKSGSRGHIHYQHTTQPSWRAKFIKPWTLSQPSGSYPTGCAPMKWLCGLCPEHRNHLRQRGTQWTWLDLQRLLNCHVSPNVWQALPEACLAATQAAPCRHGPLWHQSSQTATPPTDTAWVPLGDPESPRHRHVPRNAPPPHWQ